MNIQNGKVLGTMTYKATSELVGRVVNNSVQSQITTHDLSNLFTALLLTIALGLWQILRMLVEWRTKKRFNPWSILGWLAVDVVAFFLIVIVHVGVEQYVLKVGEPHKIVAERVGESLLRVRWATHDPQVGIMVWGYDVAHVDNISLANEGEYPTTTHDVLLEIEPQQQIYYYLVVDGVKYGMVDVEGDSKPYQVEVSQGYTLEEIEVIK